MDKLAPNDVPAAAQQGETNYQTRVTQTYEPSADAQTQLPIQPGDEVMVTYRQPDTNEQNGYQADAMYQTHQSTTAKEALNEEMIETQIDATSEIQHLLTQRREFTTHGAVDPTTVRTYLDQLASFAQQLGPLRVQLQQHLDDLNQIIDQDTVEHQGTPPA